MLCQQYSQGQAYVTGAGYGDVVTVFRGGQGFRLFDKQIGRLEAQYFRQRLQLVDGRGIIPAFPVCSAWSGSYGLFPLTAPGSV